MSRAGVAEPKFGRTGRCRPLEVTIASKLDHPPGLIALLVVVGVADGAGDLPLVVEPVAALAEDREAVVGDRGHVGRAGHGRVRRSGAKHVAMRRRRRGLVPTRAGRRALRRLKYMRRRPSDWLGRRVRRRPAGGSARDTSRAPPMYWNGELSVEMKFSSWLNAWSYSLKIRKFGDGLIVSGDSQAPSESGRPADTTWPRPRWGRLLPGSRHARVTPEMAWSGMFRM